jgi:hypothetical protein
MEDTPRAEMRLNTFEIATALGIARRLGLWRSPQILDAHLAYTALLARREDSDFARQLAEDVLPPDLLGYLRVPDGLWAGIESLDPIGRPDGIDD